MKLSMPAAYKVVPKEAFNRHLFIGVLCFGISGLARGLDEGVISSQVLMPAFKRDFNVQPGSQAQSNITSMVQIGCVGGTLLAGLVTNDWLGRIRCLQITCMLWMIGAIIWATSASSLSLGQVYAGRLIAGFGIGGTAVCGPTYLAEIAPKTLRGSLLGVGLFSACVYVGTLLGYGVNMGIQRHIPDDSKNQYLISISLNIIFSGVFLIASFFCTESPRWLAKKHRMEEAYANMLTLRQLRPEHPYLRNEWETIVNSIKAEEEAKGDNWKWYSSWQAMLKSRENVYILCCTVGAQVWGQFSGAGSIAIYAPQLFAVVSGKPTTGGQINPATTVGLGAVKLAAALLSPLLFLDQFGRKAVAMTGIVLQTVALLYIAIYLRICPADSPPSEGKTRGGEAAIAAIYVGGLAWAGGINSIQYVLGAEMYVSVVVRSLGTMISMAVHFVCQYGSSRAVNPMIDAMGHWGLFLFWGLESVVCFFLAWFFLPETAGYSLEDMHQLFIGPWYKIGWKHNRPCRAEPLSEAQLPGEVPEEDFAYGQIDEKQSESKVPVGAIITRDTDVDGIQAAEDDEPVLRYSHVPQTHLAGDPMGRDDKKAIDDSTDDDTKKA